MLHKAQLSDCDFFYELYMHPQTNPYLLYEPMSLAEFEPIFTDLIAKQALFYYEEDEQKIGMVKLLPLTYRTAHAVYLGGFAIHPRFFGQGKGTNFLQAIIQYAQNQGFKRIELSTATSNAAAIRLYEKCGFEREGILRKYTYLQSQNIYLDELMMSYLMD
ncbi:MAG: GNAT family N-acetyltransferase [Microscillaceae bacterium]|jgi:putative acetyltransferase|nr:GNAT family N-acetyltransferase [Microscillaceae bacterium]